MLAGIQTLDGHNGERRRLLKRMCCRWSRKAVIPKYGFPVDVVELDTQRTRTRQGYDVTLARDLTIAIGEFALTATLVAGKREWQSYGLKKVPEREWEPRNTGFAIDII